MKKNLTQNYLLGIILMVVFFVSCSDDETVITDSNHVSIHGVSSELLDGVIWQFDLNSAVEYKEYKFVDKYKNKKGEDKVDTIRGITVASTPITTGNFAISLYGKGIKFNQQLNTAFGEGAAITIHFASEDFESLKPGKYTYNKSRDINTFIAYSALSRDFNSTSPGYPNNITDGTIEVQIDNGIYTIDINCKTSTGSQVKGTYKGSLHSIDGRKESSINFKEDQVLQGAYDTIRYKTIYFGTEYNYKRIDYGYGNSIYNTNNSQATTPLSVYSASQDLKLYYDLGLFYNEQNKNLELAAPIEFRAKLAHIDAFIFPCYTIYNMAPMGFGEEEFNKIQSVKDFDFEVVDNKRPLELEGETLPMYVLFMNANGVKGVMKIKEINKAVPYSYSNDGEDFFMPGHNNIVFDIKTPISASAFKIK